MSHVIDAVRQRVLVFGADAINSLTIRNTFSRERKFVLDQCNKLTKAVRIKKPITGTGLFENDEHDLDKMVYTLLSYNEELNT